jgi:hypothetical protein
MIQWLTDLLYYPLANFQNASLIIFDDKIRFFLLIGLFAGVASWLLYYWLVNTEYFGRFLWWFTFGIFFSLIVFVWVQYDITSCINDGTIQYRGSPPNNWQLAVSNLFFLGFTFSIYFLFSLPKFLRGHRLKRIPF